MINLDLVTFNSWKCDGNYPERLTQAESLFNKLSADVYLLQEVFISEEGPYNTLEQLFPQPSDLNKLFQPARFKKRNLKQHSINGFSGLALVTRHPIISHGCFSLTASSLDPYRLCQWCVISVDGIQMSIFNTHLTHIEDQTNVRLSQFNQIACFAKRQTTAFTVIGGDMNESPDSLNLDHEFNCCFNESYPNTLNLGDKACLDHFYFHNTHIDIESCNTNLILDQKYLDGFASDHKAVLANVTIKSVQK